MILEVCSTSKQEMSTDKGKIYLENARVEIIKRSRSDLIKTFFEIMAVFFGIGGVYFTIKNTGSTALFLDSISVVTAIVALTMGIQHFNSLNEFNLVKKLNYLGGLKYCFLKLLRIENVYAYLRRSRDHRKAS